MSNDQNRSGYVDHLRQVYGLGVKDSDNTVASYDHYFRVMRPGLSLGRLVEDVLKRKPVMRIVDVGCGDAGMLKELLRKHPGKIEAHGIDLVTPRVGKQGLHLHEGDAAELPFPADCDLIVSFRSMHEVGALDRMVPKVAQALAVGGKAFLSVRVCEWTSGIEFQGCMTQADVDWLRAATGKATIDGARITCAEVMGQLPNDRSVTFVRGVNVFLDRV